MLKLVSERYLKINPVYHVLVANSHFFWFGYSAAVIDNKNLQIRNMWAFSRGMQHCT